jgi:hypothetical protein
MRTCSKILILVFAALVFAGLGWAQLFGGRGRGITRGMNYLGGGSADEPLISDEGGETVNEDTVRTARETPQHSDSEATPNWTNAPGFDRDVFAFTRIIYKWTSTPTTRGRGGFNRGALRWVNDYPDADLNLSFRLQQMTSMKVDPDGRVLKLTNPDLLNYPFIYMVKPMGLEFRDAEVPILRKYLLNGGVLMADDFWGDSQWNSFAAQIKRVLPERQWTDLPLSHPVFHCVFDIKVTEMNKLQVPSIHLWERSRNSESGQYGGYAARRGDGSPDMHVRALFDDKGRIMVIATHNTDNGDGWEREGENHDYFQIFSEQRAYPLGINIIFYVMTH